MPDGFYNPYVAYVFGAWAVLVIVGGLIGSMRNRLVLGMMLGFLLGPLGWLVTGFLPKDEEEGSPVVSLLGALAVMFVTGSYLLTAMDRNRDLVDARLADFRNFWNGVHGRNLPPAPATRQTGTWPAPTPWPPRVQLTPRPQPNAQATNAEILRKYGSPPGQ